MTQNILASLKWATGMAAEAIAARESSDDPDDKKLLAEHRAELAKAESLIAAGGGQIDPIGVRLLEAVKGMVDAYLEDYEQGLGDGTYEGDAENRANFAAYQQTQADMDAAIAAAKTAPVAPGSHAAAFAVILDALDYEHDAFETQEEVEGGDLLEWFVDWRGRAKAALAETRFPEIAVPLWDGDNYHMDAASVRMVREGSLTALHMSRPGAGVDDWNATSLSVERRPEGWWIGLYPNSQDPERSFLILDNGQITEVPV